MQFKKPRRTHDLPEFVEYARKKGGVCLSQRYTNYITPLRFRCKESHAFTLPASKILSRGSWCWKCHQKTSHKPFLTINKVDKLARKKGGQCLSKTYRGANYPLKFRCNKGHKWVATPNGLIYRGRWCATCAKNVRLDIKVAQTEARKHGGKCLSKYYKNKDQTLLWECAEGHRWETSLGLVRNRGTWCAKCRLAAAGKRRRLTIALIQNIARERGGRFLSNEYSGNSIPYFWRCAHGHEWKATVSGIRGGSWCPECASGYSERCVRICFQTLFGRPFPKTRPVWLRAENGRLLELDGYNKKLRLAFEHQGKQHSVYLRKYFGGKRSLFKRRLSLDKLKKRLCRKNRVRLICIPQLETDLKINDLKGFVLKRCKALGVSVRAFPIQKNVDYAPAFRPLKTDWLQRLRDSCKSQQGSCLSKTWLGWRSKYHFRCSRGHLWKTTPQSLLRDKSWCRRCHLKDTNFLKTTPQQARDFARKKAGKFLDYNKPYKGSLHRYWWECADGHKWHTTFTHLKGGTWCPYCSGNRRLPRSWRN